MYQRITDEMPLADPTPDPTLRILAAIADPVRFDIVQQLSGGDDVCACDFDVHPRVTQPTVSHHLRVLREAGVLRSQRRGTDAHYSLDPAAVDRLAVLVSGLRPLVDLASGSDAGSGASAKHLASRGHR